MIISDNSIFVLWDYSTAMRMNELHTSRGEFTTYDFHIVKKRNQTQSSP